MPSVDVIAVVAVGGAIGSLGRWALGLAYPFQPAESLPWATLLANLSGAVLLGVVMVVVMEVRPGGRLVRPFWGVGVCGGYTTFSGYVLEIDQMMGVGRVGMGLLYLFGSVVLALVGVGLGMAGARLAARVIR